MNLYILILLVFVTKAELSKIGLNDEIEQHRALKFEWETIVEFMRDQYIVTLFVEPHYQYQSAQILKDLVNNYRFGCFHYNNITLMMQFWATFQKTTLATDKRHGIIIILHDIYLLDNLVKSCINHKVVFVFFNQEVVYIKHFMTNLWARYKTFTILSLMISDQVNRFIQHNPFESKFYEYSVNRTVVSSRQFGLFLNEQFRRFMSNMSGYEIKMFVFDFPLVSALIRNSTGHVIGSLGMDGELLKFCQKFMNFTPVFVRDGPTGTGSISELATADIIENGEAEVGLSGRFILDVTFNNTVFLYPIDKVPFWFVVPINYKSEPLQILAYYYFDFTSRILSGVSLILLTLIWILGVKLLKQNAEIAAAVGIPFKVLALMHGITINVPKAMFNKIIFITIAAFGLFLTSIYQGTVVQQLNNPLKPLQINTLKDLFASDLNISVLSYFKQSDSGEGSLADNFIMMGELRHKNVIQFDTIIEGMNAVAHNKTVALLMPVIFHKPYSVRYFNKTTGLDLVHTIYEAPVKLLLSYVIARDSPYTQIFNDVTRIFVESGAMQNEIAKAGHQQQLFYIRRIKDGFIPKIGNAFRSIKLEDAVLIKYFFLGGITTSIIVFCIEHLVHFVHKHKKPLLQLKMVTLFSK